MKTIPLILMGCGGVGSHLLQHIVSSRSLHSSQGLCLRVVGIGDSKSLVVVDDLLNKGFDDSFLLELCRLKHGGESLSKLGDLGQCQVFVHPESEGKILEIASQLGKKTGLAFVDCTASSDTIVVLKQVVDLGCCVVMANKKPLTSTMGDFEKLLTYPRRIRHESTVGAGLPVISSLNRIISSGDPVNRIIGSLSGTLGYVMSEVEDGKPLSQVVRAAKSLGYTEPDPRDDLGGMDVARKALILARILGRRINMDSIQIESLYPKEMGPDVMTDDDFLSCGLLLLDKDIQERVEKAASNGNVLRYVCVIEGPRCEVGIQELPKNSALGRLRGSDNVLEVYTRCYSNQPLVIQGAGAGNDTTAAGVLADIVDIQDLFP
ncbi:putative homoserine dehydrogenase [Medicago truncatula]|uniref:Homoserine dehydrogenase n=2 Tax=Medicago truncatula TaxID=3880 RepID=B7FM35_MEDTR|nr:bifunctional aspartokinase/homoserine dehydrogenase 1 [Medicago truncatula]ACJ85818.1 unknown [Medicago truncatula]AES71565.1 homoserine dehydrogenase [Medicago truncatula]RHN68861.1 putative homoserine dehydrogenase [Medicago truncatula]